MSSWVCCRPHGWMRALASFYEPGQLRQARLVAALRQLQVPLAEIKAIPPLERVQAAERVRQLWAATEAEHASLRALAAYLMDELTERGPSYTRSARGRCPSGACCV
jgi:DNA-binding transcriptional MerR regulator